MKRTTVHDVAGRAGVSLATVARVLNRRPGVSSAMSERACATIDRLGFQRDRCAASLATSRRHRFVFVLPKIDGNTCIRILRDEITAQVDRLSSRRIQLSVLDYTAFDPQALATTRQAAARQPIDGLALVAIDAPRCRQPSRHCTRAASPSSPWYPT